MNDLTRLSLRFFARAKRWLPMALCCIPVVVIGVLAAMGAGLFGNGRVFTMDGNAIFLLAMGLACPIGMGLMMWLMNRQMSQHMEPLSSDKQKRFSPVDRLVALQEERRTLDAEIAELSQEVERDEQYPLVVSGSPSLPEDTSFSEVR